MRIIEYRGNEFFSQANFQASLTKEYGQVEKENKSDELFILILGWFTWAEMKWFCALFLVVNKKGHLHDGDTQTVNLLLASWFLVGTILQP